MTAFDKSAGFVNFFVNCHVPQALDFTGFEALFCVNFCVNYLLMSGCKKYTLMIGLCLVKGRFHFLPPAAHLDVVCTCIAALEPVQTGQVSSAYERENLIGLTGDLVGSLAYVIRSW